MKESKLLEMQNKITSLINVVQHLMSENTQLKDLAVGTLETLKLMPGYDEAIKELQDKLNKKESKENGVVKQDTK